MLHISIFSSRLKRGLTIPTLALMAVLFSGWTGCNRSEKSTDVVAKVNDEKILRSEVEKYYSNQTAGSPQQPSGEQAASLKLSILKQLIDEEIMLQRARKLGLLASDEEVEAKFTEFKSPYTKEEFEKKLKERSMSEEEFKKAIRRNMTVEKVINKEITSKINITDADISSYYNEHKAEFNFIEPQFHIAQIIVTPYPSQQVQNLKNDKATNDADARKKIQMIANRLEAGEDFATVAMNYSEQPNTAPNGGDMGFIPESALKQDPQAFEAISRLKIGQITGPMEVREGRQLAGYRIIKLIAREPAGQRELSDPRVQAAVRQQLRERREQLLKAAYYEVVRNETKVENYLADDLLKNSGTLKQ